MSINEEKIISVCLFLHILISFMTTNPAILAITKHGIEIARKIKNKIPAAEIYVPIKHSDSKSDIHWFTDQTGNIVSRLFKSHDALICIFSLGAVIRLIAPLVVNKKSDPAVLVIDDKANFVISALSGHLGGANSLARLVASFFPKSMAVITTAADVNETVAVDLLGKQFSWEIENYENVTKVSALMVNEEKIGLYQDTGEKNWWHMQSLPQNVVQVTNIEDLKSPYFRGALIISDKIITDPVVLDKSVIYRPKSLVLGIGLHWNTSKDTIEEAIQSLMTSHGLSLKCIRNISSINREGKVRGLQEFSEKYHIPVEVYDKNTLAKVEVPNPSGTVQKFEGTPSVSEASSIVSSKGSLIVPKQKFPPDLTVAISRIDFN